MVELQPSKLAVRVRFPSPAPPRPLTGRGAGLTCPRRQTAPPKRAVRNDPSKPGRLIAVNDGDSNTNGVPDFVDLRHSNRFVRVELDVTKVADTIDWGTARVRFNYSASDPAQVQTNVTTVGSITVTNYVAQAGFMRLWTKDGLAQRNPASVTEGGDYVPAGVELMATNLFASGTTSLPFYVEGISPATSEYASIAATVRAGPGAPPTLQMEDEVRVTIFKVDLDVDTDRDGTVDDADEEDEDSWTLSRGAFVSVDDAPVISSENIPSLVPVVLRSLNLSSHEGMSASLAVEGNDQIRLMKADGMIVWPAGDQGPCDLAPEIASHELTLYAAATKDLSAFATKASAKTRITLTVRDAGDNSLGSDTVEMQVAPIILAWNSLAMEKLYVTSEFPEDVCAAKQISYEPFPVWTQDYMELGVSGVTANRATDQVTDLHHRYGSTAYVQDMLDDASAGHPHWHRGTWDNGGNGVNIEVYPPYEGHPYGRIVMLPQSDPNCFKKIQAQGIQAPIQVSKYDGWLTVGHIDELFCFLQPAYVLVADPAKAWVEIIDLLNTPSADTQLYVGGCDVSMEDATIDVSSDMNFFFAQTCPLEQYLPLGASTMTVTQGQYEVGDYLLIEREVLKVTGVAQINGVTELTVERGLEFGNSGQSHQPGAKIRKLSEEFAINVYDGQVGFSLYDRIKDMESELKTDLGTSFSTVRVPVVFGIFRNQWGADVGRVAFTANMVNCVVDGHTLYATDPGNSRFRELLRAHVSGQVVFPAGATAWDNYHRWAGEIHCGSNAKRTFPDAAWWSHEAFSNWGE